MTTPPRPSGPRPEIVRRPRLVAPFRAAEIGWSQRDAPERCPLRFPFFRLGLGPRPGGNWSASRATRSDCSTSATAATATPSRCDVAGNGRFVMLSDPEAVREVFRGDPEVLHSGEANSLFTATVGRHSVLVLDGAPHARQRRVVVPPLKGERMRAFFDAMRLETLEAVRAWPVGTALPHPADDAADHPAGHPPDGAGPRPRPGDGPLRAEDGDVPVQRPAAATPWC